MERPREKKKMIATQQEMMDAKVPLDLRDYCAHFFIPMVKCQRETYYAPWQCKRERHAWEHCRHSDLLDRIRQKRREEKKKQEQNSA